MTATKTFQPNFTATELIEPSHLADFCNRFELALVNLSDIEPISQEIDGIQKLVGARVGNDAFYVSPRFLKSLMTLFGFMENIFRYFSPEELFGRIIQRHDNQTIQVCFDQKEKVVLAATKHDQTNFPLAKVIEAVQQQSDRLIGLKYHPKSGLLATSLVQPNQWQIKSDSEYRGWMRFTTPVDSWGDSKIVLGSIRKVCENGAVVTKDIYSSKVILERQHGTHLRHLLETFRNDRAFAAMERRLEDARRIQISAAEYLRACQLFAMYGGEYAQQIVERVEEFAGYPEQYYQCDSFEKIQPVRRRDLPVELSLLNLLNMISEVMTHHQQEDNFELERFYTTLMAHTTDLEGIYSIDQPVRELFFSDLAQGA